MSLISVFDYFTNSLGTPPHTAPPSPAVMALQIQVPILPSSTPAASPPSRPHSPHLGYRPSSRSERLLRDTLRKADERQSRDPSLTRRTSSRRRKSHPVDDELQELDEGTWLSNGPRTAQIIRRQSTSHTPSRCPSPEAHISCSPHAPTLSRTHTAPSPIQHRASHSLSSMPIPRSSAASPSPASSLQRSTPTPHEAVLRARLETVLSRVSSAPQVQPQGRPHSKTLPNAVRAHPHVLGHARSQSLMASPVVAHGDWPWAGSPDSYDPDPEPAAPLTPPPTPPSSVSPLTPATPPSPFNARAASQLCRQLPGYVSFQDVEGLGEPPSTEDEDDQVGIEAKSKEDRKWWNWPWSGRARAQSR